jgi:hypothetical protein
VPRAAQVCARERRALCCVAARLQGCARRGRASLTASIPCLWRLSLAASERLTFASTRHCSLGTRDCCLGMTTRCDHSKKNRIDRKAASYTHGSADPHHLFQNLFQKSFHLASFLALAALLRPRVCKCTLSVSCHHKRNRRVSSGLREGTAPRPRTKLPLAPWEETPQAPWGHRAGTLGSKVPVCMAGTLGSELPVYCTVRVHAHPTRITALRAAQTDRQQARGCCWPLLPCSLSAPHDLKRHPISPVIPPLVVIGNFPSLLR